MSTATPFMASFPHSVKEIENLWIPLSDGIRLAARIWMPEDAPPNPVPAILEYLPYRKDDGTCERDALTYPYFAGHGSGQFLGKFAAIIRPHEGLWQAD